MFGCLPRLSCVSYSSSNIGIALVVLGGKFGGVASAHILSPIGACIPLTTHSLESYGTAVWCLVSLQILRKIPRSFPRMEDAILWHIKTGAVRNSASAYAVVPSRLKRDQDGGKA